MRRFAVKYHDEEMLAVVCRAPQDYKLENVKRPAAGPNEVIIKIMSCGICAGDCKGFAGAPRFWGDKDAGKLGYVGAYGTAVGIIYLQPYSSINGANIVLEAEESITLSYVSSLNIALEKKVQSISKKILVLRPKFHSWVIYLMLGNYSAESLNKTINASCLFLLRRELLMTL